MRRLIVAAAALICTSLATVAAASASDVKVTDQTYTRHDGGSDSVISTCSNFSADSQYGGHRQQNEPAVAVDPGEPSFIVVAANDYCGIPTFGDAFEGIYTSTDGGATWKDSLLPGYPGDTSGAPSPLVSAGDTNAGDPVLDWDNSGHLFTGGIAFNRTATRAESGVTPTNGNTFVSTWSRDPSSPIGISYVQTVIVGQGTPSASLEGKLSDKPSLKVDDWSIVQSPFAGNVYTAWNLDTGAGGPSPGQNSRILFARSTDEGQTFSKPIIISKNIPNALGTDIAVSPNGDVYVFWRQFGFVANSGDGIVYVKSTDGGKTFGDPYFAFSIDPYDRSDAYVIGGGAGFCGSLIFKCQSGFTFHRTVTLPQATADSSGNLYATHEQLSATSDNGDSYQPDGQSKVMVSKSTDGGSTWSTTTVDSQGVGDQFWPNIEYDKSNGTLALIYYDSREDTSYSVNRPPGNRSNGKSVCESGGVGTTPCDVLNTFIAASTNGGISWIQTKVSTVGHQPNYEMFSGRIVAFEGDYIGVDADGGKIIGAWTDDRDVVPGSDPRESDADGFDVLQCRATPDAQDTCANGGGLNQNIYAASP